MTQLKELQERFQKALLEGDLSILSHIPDSQREKKEALLGVYQYAYSARLMEFLQNDYPQLWAYLGDEQFEMLCMAYIKATPSHHPNARWYGEKLPAFMKATAPWNQQAQLAELALLEHYMNSVFDERDEPALELDHLTSLPPEQWSELVFTPIAATRRLDLTTNAADIWDALAMGETPPEVEKQKQPQNYLTYRQNGQGSFRSLPYEEAMMWDKMAAGVPFGILCELMATYGGEDDAALRAASFLQGWITAKLIVGQPGTAHE